MLNKICLIYMMLGLGLSPDDFCVGRPASHQRVERPSKKVFSSANENDPLVEEYEEEVDELSQENFLEGISSGDGSSSGDDSSSGDGSSSGDFVFNDYFLDDEYHDILQNIMTYPTPVNENIQIFDAMDFIYSSWNGVIIFTDDENFYSYLKTIPSNFFNHLDPKYFLVTKDKRTDCLATSFADDDFYFHKELDVTNNIPYAETYINIDECNSETNFWVPRAVSGAISLQSDDKDAGKDSDDFSESDVDLSEFGLCCDEDEIPDEDTFTYEENYHRDSNSNCRIL